MRKGENNPDLKGLSRQAFRHRHNRQELTDKCQSTFLAALSILAMGFAGRPSAKVASFCCNGSKRWERRPLIDYRKPASVERGGKRPRVNVADF